MRRVICRLPGNLAQVNPGTDPPGLVNRKHVADLCLLPVSRVGIWPYEYYIPATCPCSVRCRSDNLHSECILPADEALSDCILKVGVGEDGAVVIVAGKVVTFSIDKYPGTVR